MSEIINKAQNLFVTSSLARILVPWGKGHENLPIDRHTIVLRIIEMLITRSFGQRITRDELNLEVKEMVAEQCLSEGWQTPEETVTREAGRIVDFLLDKGGFTARFFDWETKSFKSNPPFYFLKEAEDKDEVLYVHPTNESINLFLNALEKSITEAQLGINAMVKYLLSTGHYSESKLKVEEHINTTNAHVGQIMNLRRSLRHDIDNTRFEDIKETLNRTLQDTTMFIQIDKDIQREVHNILENDVFDDEDYLQLQDVIKGVMQCIDIYSKLDEEIRSILSEFITQKSRLISSSRTGVLLDIETFIEKPLLEMDAEKATQTADKLVDALLPAAPEKVFDPMNVLFLLMNNARDYVDDKSDFMEQFEESRQIACELSDEVPKDKDLDKAREILGQARGTKLSNLVRRTIKTHTMDVARCLPYLVHTEWGLELENSRSLNQWADIQDVMSFTDMLIRPEDDSRHHETGSTIASKGEDEQ